MNYLAHEYLNENWNPISFLDAHRNFSSAKLSWGCSADMLDSISEINFNSSQIAILEEIDNIALRQAVVDLFLNTQFRKDYWVKGARTLSDLEQAEQLRAQRIVLTVRRADVNLKVKGGLGEATMQDTVYNPILNALADHKVKTLGQLEQELKASKDGGSITFAELLQAALVLGASGAVAVAQDDSTAQKLKKQTDKLNRHIMLNRLLKNSFGACIDDYFRAIGDHFVGWYRQHFFLKIKQDHQKYAVEMGQSFFLRFSAGSGSEFVHRWTSRGP